MSPVTFSEKLRVKTIGENLVLDPDGETVTEGDVLSSVTLLPSEVALTTSPALPARSVTPTVNGTSPAGSELAIT